MQVITLYRLKTNDRWRRDRSRLENMTKKRHLLLTGHCSYRDVASVLVYQWREDFVGDDFNRGREGGGGVAVAVLSPTLNMEDFKHSPYWKHRFVMRVQFFKGSVFNHVGEERR